MEFQPYFMFDFVYVCIFKYKCMFEINAHKLCIFIYFIYFLSFMMKLKFILSHAFLYNILLLLYCTFHTPVHHSHHSSVGSLENVSFLPRKRLLSSTTTPNQLRPIIHSNNDARFNFLKSNVDVDGWHHSMPFTLSIFVTPFNNNNSFQSTTRIIFELGDCLEHINNDNIIANKQLSGALQFGLNKENRFFVRLFDSTCSHATSIHLQSLSIANQNQNHITIVSTGSVVTFYVQGNKDASRSIPSSFAISSAHQQHHSYDVVLAHSLLSLDNENQLAGDSNYAPFHGQISGVLFDSELDQNDLNQQKQQCQSNMNCIQNIIQQVYIDVYFYYLQIRLIFFFFFKSFIF